MIRRLSANSAAFQSIDFGPGFNVVLAERDPRATEKHSRNARGKTSALQAINYVLGSTLPTAFKPLAVLGWAFELTFDLFGSEVTAERACKGGRQVRVNYPPSLTPFLGPWVNGDSEIALDDWKELLGLSMFRLESAEVEGARALSPRTLLSYVTRIDPGKDPFKVVPGQPAWSSRQHIAFLLGLDWRLVRNIHDIKENLKTLDAIRDATHQGLLPSLRNEDELVLAQTEARNELARLEATVNGFQILEDPDGLVARADELSEALRDLRNEALVDRRTLALYERALSEPEDHARARSDVLDVYHEAGRVFAEQTLARLDDVVEFHERLVQNRTELLRADVAEITARVADRDREMARLQERREAILQQLQAGGALEELQAQNRELTSVRERLAAINASLETVRETAETREALRLEKAQLRQESVHRLNDDRTKLDRISTRFDEIFQDLYGQSGVLTVRVDDSGYNFKISVAGSASVGVNRMQLFAFDLTLLDEGTRVGHHPDFLIHDSSVFDGVDPRQVAAALGIAQRAVEDVGGQYICALNSNDVPEGVRDAEWFRSGIRRVILDTEPGGAMGIEF